MTPAPVTPLASSVDARPWWARYGVAVACVFLGWVAREAISPVVGPTAIPFIFFFPAIAAAAWYGGHRPATLAVFLALLSARGSFLPSSASDAPSLAEIAALLAFVLASSVIVAAIEATHRARRRLLEEVDVRRRLERTATEARDLLATTLRSIGDGVIVTDGKGHVTFLNPEAERLTGWKTEDARGEALDTVFRIVDEATRRPVANPVQTVLRTGALVGLANHTLLLARGGAETPIDDSAAPVREGDGPISGVVLVFRNVLEHRRAQIALARLAAIVEHSGDAIVTKNLDGVIQTWNASAEQLFGYTPEEAIGRPITLLIPPERLDEEPRILANLRAGEAVERMETVRVTKDGRRIHVAISVSPLKDSSGNVVGASKIVHDVTEIRAAREALLREKELLATTLACIGDAVVVTDETGRITFLNAEAARLTGWTEADARGRPLADVFHIVNEHTREPVESPVDKVLGLGSVVGLANHTILVARDGRETPIDDSAAPIRRAGEDLFGVVLVFRDITERKRAENALLDADRRKDEFLATLSHELRNPIAPIRLAVSMMRKVGAAQGELQELRDVIDRQATQLARLLDDLLDVSRVASGKIVLRTGRVSIGVAVSSALETSRPLLDSLGHELVVQMPSEPIEVEADLGRLAQVFANLLNNAAKYTERGGRITLTIAQEGGEAVLRVRDTGIGLGPDQVTRIFEMFAQVDHSLERGQGGLGVGLSLARKLVDLHGGRIEVHSDGLGKGSEFVVRLPALARGARAAPGSAPATEMMRRREGRRVLIADDNADSAALLAMALADAGHEVQAVHDGRAALERAESFRPEVALLDIGMPEVNGYEVARRLRAAFGPELVLVAITGWGQASDRERASAAGFDHHLTKPVELAAIDRLIP